MPPAREDTPALRFAAGGGELGARIRSYPWEDTVLGPLEQWPQSLKTAVGIMLTSRQPIWIGWGPQLLYLYNDAYKSIIGGKHPQMLGQPTAIVWREIWDDIAPMLATAMDGSEGIYVEEQLLIMERNGYREETYYTFSYSPIPDDDGTPGGIICANTDDTLRVIGERQLASLREVATSAIDFSAWTDVAQRCARALATNPQDMPFALLYLEETHGGDLVLAGCSGVDAGHPAAPRRLDPLSGAPWPVAEALVNHEPRIVDDLRDRLGAALPTGYWQTAPEKAVIYPVVPTGETARRGILVAGLNPYRLFDENYRGFMGLVAGQIAAAISSAEAYEEERRRVDALAEIDKAKTMFFSNVSHEFRTPLALMLGPIEEALSDGELAKPVRESLQTVHRNGLRLLKLVNSLLDFSRIEAGRTEAHFEATDLAALTADLVSNFRSATEKAGLSLHVDCAPLSAASYVDVDMWEKIVLNLLSNAFKFTFEGGIAVALKEADGQAVLTVRDTGTGIPAEQVPKLFERFHRVEGARGRSFEGSGIGLALVQELVKLHKGTITAHSVEGEGSTFTVAVPLGKEHLPSSQIRVRQERPPTAARTAAFTEEALRWLPNAGDGAREAEVDWHEAPAGTSRRATILLADDNADMRDYVARLLQDDHDVIAVANGRDAVEQLKRHRPDLVLTDLMMPVMDGFELIRTIRRDEKLRDLPVIVLSARAGSESSVEGLDAGADDYLVKPFSARELVARVGAALTLADMRQQISAALRESEARFRNMADNAPVMIWTTAPDGSCTYLSKSWYDFTGQTPETALGHGWLDAVHPDDRRRSDATFAEANERHASFTMDYRLRRTDGTYGWAVDAATPWFDAEGTFKGYIGSVVDIDERRNVEQAQRNLNQTLQTKIKEAIAEREAAEANLLRAQKMEAIGKLTGGIAHDFNNLLQVIGGNLQLLQKDVVGNQKAEERLRNAISGVSRGGKLATQLLAFGRRQPLEPKATNLGRLVRGLDEILRRTLGEQIQMETIVAAGLWNTMVDPTQVENAILNLAINARDAMQGLGRLTIEAGNAYFDDSYALSNEVPAGQYVMLAVSDDGPGMTPEVIDQAFEPFFTTKPEGQGTGLGLSMVYGFVKQSGGHVKIYSEIGQGTTVRIYLPRVMQLEEVAVEAPVQDVTGGNETILVAEDDTEVRSTVVDMLTDLGYRVLRAQDAQSAFAILESGIPIDLLFTDVVMPGQMRSTELARRAKERWPSLAILFTSGYTENAIVHGGRLDEGIELLSKPYTREVLARKIRSVLRNRAATPGQSPSRQAVNAVETPRPAPPGPLNILVVEDEMLIRMATVDSLTDLGHTTAQAGNARDAMKFIEEREWDLLLTDVGLVGASGVDLALNAVRHRPDIGIVFVTGHKHVAGREAHPELERSVVLPKPFAEEELAQAVSQAMAARP